MERKIMKKLIEWKENNAKTPLMIIGARQIGKTYIIENFCMQYFKDYVYINLEKNKEVVDIFKSTIDPEKIISQIELLINKVITEETIIFLDEIQESEEAITSLKYFCESEKNYKIVTAGSLLGVKLNRFGSSFPVGKVKIIYMYPMDFEEFLLAINRKDLVLEIRRCYNNLEPLSTPVHELLIDLYRKYICIGGMPSAVLNFIENEMNLVKFDKEILKTILENYLADMSKYTLNKSEAIKISSIYNKMPAQLAKDNKKFNYKLIGEYACKRDFKTALDWLISSNLLYKCPLVTTIQIPLKAYIDDDTFKMYLSDVGLLISMCEIEFSDIILNKDFLFKGAIAENYVAQTFVTNGKSIYYWKSKSEAEIDFILYNQDGIIPVEVKANDNVQSKSLNSYIKSYDPSYAIRLSLKNFGYKNKIKSIPLYAAYLI